MTLLRRVPAWVWPLALGVAVFQPAVLVIGPDSAWYWALGRNLANGLGYVGSEWLPELRRGPGLALLLAGSFRIFGEDISSAAWILRAFFVASALVTYALGARWFGRGVGVVAAFGLLTSPIVASVASTISVDIVGITFVLLAVLALEFESWAGAAAAGLALMAAGMTKEATLVVVAPLALHAALGARRGRRLAHLGLAATAAALALALWTFAAGGGSLLADRAASLLGSGGPGGSFAIAKLFRGLASFAAGTASATWMWPGFVLGWFAVGFAAFRRGSAPDRLMLWLLLSQLPVILLQGLYGLRTGQSFLLYPLSFLAFGRAVQLAAQCYAPERRLQALAAAAVLVVAAGAAKAPPSHWLRSALAQAEASDGARPWTLNPLAIPKDLPSGEAWLNYAVTDAARWLAENTAADEVLVSDWYWADSLYLRTDGKRPIYRIPYLPSRDVSHMALESAAPPPNVDSYAPALFVFTQYGRTDPAHPDAWVSALSEPLLLARLEELKADWLVVTKRRAMIADYFDASPSFDLAYVGPDAWIKIYRVRRPLSPTLWDTGLTTELGQYLDALAASDPSGYQALVADYFEARLGVGASEVAEWRELLRASVRERTRDPHGTPRGDAVSGD